MGRVKTIKNGTYPQFSHNIYINDSINFHVVILEYQKCSMDFINIIIMHIILIYVIKQKKYMYYLWLAIHSVSLEYNLILKVHP